MIKVSFKVTRNIGKLRKIQDRIIKIKDNFYNSMKNVLPKMIVDDILEGISPVANHRFKPYAQSYRKVIKKYYKNKSISPVNMKLTGNMLKSIRFLKGGNLNTIAEVMFEDAKAYYHTVAGIKRKDGLVVRKLLPIKPNEKFNTEITLAIRECLHKIIFK